MSSFQEWIWLPFPKLEFLPLNWAVTESLQEYLYGNTFTVYSDNNPLTHVLTTAKLDATGHLWISKLAKLNFTIHYCSEKSNGDADKLSQIPVDQNIEADAIGAIFRATVDDSEAAMYVYACHKRAVSSLVLESHPT